MRTRALALLALTAPLAAEAAAPSLVPVTGYLTDDAGAPIDGTTTLQLKLYSAATSGTTLWNESQDVDVVDGQFTVYLGEVTPLGLDLFRDNGTLFLGIAVETGSEMAPRFQVATAPFAAYAEYCDDASMLGGVDSSEYRLITDPVQWSDLQAVPAGISDGDADTTYTAGSGLTLTGTTFTANQTTIEGWAEAVAYDSVTELRADLDAIYQAKMTCTPNQVLMANGSGAWLCTDASALPLNESTIDALVANNGYAADAALSALTSRVGTAEGNITTLTTGLAAEVTNRTTAVSAEATARAAADTTLTTGLAAEVTARGTAVAAEATARANADTTLTTNLATTNTNLGTTNTALAAETAARIAAFQGTVTSVAFSAHDSAGDWCKNCSAASADGEGNNKRVVMNAVDINVGGAYNPTTGELRAPTSGLYMLCLNFLHGNQPDDYINIRVWVNDTWPSFPSEHFLYDPSDYNDWHYSFACEMVPLNAGDRVGLQVYGSRGIYEDPDENHERMYGWKL